MRDAMLRVRQCFFGPGPTQGNLRGFTSRMCKRALLVLPCGKKPDMKRVQLCIPDAGSDCGILVKQATGFFC